MSTILLRLAAPLQSWGYDSIYDRRNTNYYPTKSGVIGIIAAALGRTREDSIKNLADCKFGIRIDRQGSILSDFQTTEMQNYLNKGYKSNVSKREYLSDAVFLAGLEYNDEKLVENIVEALKYPKFSLFLGRKSCPPTYPLFLKTTTLDLYLALQKEDWLVPEWQAQRKKDPSKLRIIVDSTQSKAVVRDVPLSYSPKKREYTYRGIHEMPSVMISTKMPEHDPMKELR